MKIKIIYYVFPYIIGGTERFLLSLIKRLDREKFEPIVISHAPGVTIQMFKRFGIETRIVDMNHAKKFDILVNFLKRSKIDIAQSNYYYAVLAMAANAADISHIWQLGVIYPDLNSQRKRHLLNMISSLSEKVVCSSKFLSRQFKDVRTFKVKMIYNGIPFDEIDSIHPDYKLFKEFDCGKGCPAIGMVAHLSSPQKRHIDFIHAAKIVKRCLPNSKFFIIGTTYPNKEGLDYARYLYKTVKDIGMDKDILFTGFRKDILKTIARMDLVVLPSIGEGLGLAILEAMGCGKPVVGSNSGGLKEIVVNKKTGLLVPPKNPNKLAEAMIEILKDPKRARSMGEAGRKRARRLFDITKSVRQYEELYQKVYNESTK